MIRRSFFSIFWFQSPSSGVLSGGRAQGGHACQYALDGGARARDRRVVLDVRGQIAHAVRVGQRRTQRRVCGRREPQPMHDFVLDALFEAGVRDEGLVFAQYHQEAQQLEQSRQEHALLVVVGERVLLAQRFGAVHRVGVAHRRHIARLSHPAQHSESMQHIRERMIRRQHTHGCLTRQHIQIQHEHSVCLIAPIAHMQRHYVTAQLP
mmetsp:Transcript_5070/g.8223  ORF Transcript_5070/g.8223 Transcript_5070/m.8223 type:complete len:208 (-) Transcript_5070:1833-2456(-)